MDGEAGGPQPEPETAALLAQMAVDFAGAPADPTVEERRAGLKAAAELYGPPPALVARMVQAEANGPRGAVPLRVYTAAGAALHLRPLVLHIHGGGWVLGDPEGYERVARAYCAAGDCVLVDVDYRRAPEHKHPAALEDCLAALEWAVKNARRLGADPRRIVITGDSAGGHLAAAVCQTTTRAIALQLLVYPVMDASPSASHASRQALGDGRFFLREFDILRAEREYFTDEQVAQREIAPASPVRAPAGVLRRLPPTVVITAGLDPLVDEGSAYVAAIRAAGGRAEELRYDGTIHAFVLFAGRLSAGRRAIAEIGDRIRHVKPARGRWFGL